MTFYIGLSLLSNCRLRLPSHEDLSNEGRKILLQLDKELCGTEKSANQTILLEASGKPYFKDRHAEFSISHSASMAAVALIVNSEPHSSDRALIGCDIQYMNPRKKYGAISAEFFHPEECVFINEAANADDRLRRFYSIWVLKESFVKMMGWSVFDILKTPKFLPQNVTGTADGQYEYSFQKRTGDSLSDIVCCIKEYEDDQSKRYMLGVILKSSEEAQPVIRWFSKKHLA